MFFSQNLYMNTHHCRKNAITWRIMIFIWRHWYKRFSFLVRNTIHFFDPRIFFKVLNNENWEFLIFLHNKLKKTKCLLELLFFKWQKNKYQQFFLFVVGSNAFQEKKVSSSENSWKKYINFSYNKSKFVHLLDFCFLQKVGYSLVGAGAGSCVSAHKGNLI